MERIEQYTVRMLDATNEATDFAAAAWSAGKWMLAIFAAVAFAFGLVHGLGFASVLADLGLHGANLVLSLLGFNLGVEIGQMLIVLAVLPFAFLLRDTTLYRRTFLPAGSAAIMLLAGYWLVMRMTGAGLG